MGLAILKSFSSKKPVIYHMIHRNLAHSEPARNDGLVHASDLMKELPFCPREWVLRRLLGVSPKAQFIPTALAITFEHGKATERNLRNRWLAGHVVGFWKCSHCGHNHEAYGKHPKINCPACNAWSWEYVEVVFQSPVSGVTGSLDVIVDVGEKLHRVVECKTLDKDEHKALVAPLAEHRARTSLYLRLAEESGLVHSRSINVREAHVLYVSRSYGFKDTSLKEAGITDFPFSPFKEFVVSRDDSLTESVLNRAKVVYDLKDTTVEAVPCGICTTGMDKRAVACPVRAQCWGAHYPGSVTWLERGVPKHPGRTVL